MSEPTVQASASLSMVPTGSNVLLSLLTVVALIFGVLGYWLIEKDNVGGYLFVLISLVLIGLIFIGFLRTHSNIDLSQSHPLLYEHADGTKISTDVRTIAHPIAAKAFSQAIEVLAHRKPIPVAQGLLNENGQLIPESGALAQKKSEEINIEAQARAEKSYANIRAATFTEATLEQPSSPHPPPGAISNPQ